MAPRNIGRLCRERQFMPGEKRCREHPLNPLRRAPNHSVYRAFHRRSQSPAGSGPGLATGMPELCGAAMTGVAALSAVSIPGTAPAMPNTGDGAPGTGSIFDALLAALAPIVSDQSGSAAQAAPQAAPQAMPPDPAGVSDATTTQPVAPDAIASLETALGDAMAALQLPP